MTTIYSETFWELFDDLDQSLGPTGPDTLYDIAAPYIPPEPHVLDLGCRDASHLIRLVGSSGSGLGVDPVPWHVQRSLDNVAAAGLDDRVQVVRGEAEQIPSADESFDVVWCRDVIEVLPDLDRAIGEVSRVLRPGAHMIGYTNILNGPPRDEETETIHEPLGNVVGNLVEANLDHAFRRHGLTVVERRVIATEWREYMEELQGIVSRDLLRLARLRRRQSKIVDEYGLQAYRTAQASLQWAAHQFLGRFVPIVYVLQKAPD